MATSHQCYGEERERLLGQIHLALVADERVAGAWLAGSIGRGTADALSDLDLWLAVEDTALADIAANPERFVHGITPTIMEIPAPSIAPPGGAFLLTWVAGSQGPQPVDWYLLPVASARRPLRTRLLFERRAILVAAEPQPLTDAALNRAIDDAIRDALLMTFVTTKHIVRNNPWRITRHLEHVARTVGTLEWLLGHGTQPAVDEPLLPATFPVGQTEQLDLLQELRGKLGDLLARSGRTKYYAAATQAVDAAMQARRRPPSATFLSTSANEETALQCAQEMSVNRNDVRAFYDSFGEREWARLAQPADGALEFAITCHTLATYLPREGRVLDLGGGPGRYSLWLADRGYRVVLADLSPALLEIARDKVVQSHVPGQVEEIVEADARNLSRWPDSAFDAVLALGPFYHLPDPADQARAAAELARVLRPGGMAFIALVPRYALLRRVIAALDERHQLVQEGFLERLMEEGVFINEVPGRFTGVSGVQPQEVAPFFESHGFTSHDLLACESIIPDLQEEFAHIGEWDPDAYQRVLEGLIRIAGDPSILGMSTHLLYVASKTP